MPKITSELLDKWQEGTAKSSNASELPFDDKEEILELIRLARLGLWAEEHGHLMREALASLNYLNRETGHDHSLRADIKKAIEKLPREGT